MRKILLCTAAVAATFWSAAAVQAASTLVYSFESPTVMPDGFFGLGATTSQDTIGATEGSFSLKYDVGNGGFVGARTETVIPAALGNPPGVDYVLFDMYVPAAYGGTFADMGVTVFGHDIPDSLFGLQAQFGQDGSPGSLLSIAALAPGQYHDLRINLTGAQNPVTFATGESFNQIFGPGPGQLTVASAFQFFISKNGDCSSDRVRRQRPTRREFLNRRLDSSRAWELASLG